MIQVKEEHHFIPNPNNPVKAKLVDVTTAWVFSSAKDYEGLRKGTLVNKDLTKSLGLLKL